MELNRYGEPVDHYWKWMQEIERNTERLARRRSSRPPARYVQSHFPDDPELAYYLAGGDTEFDEQ